MKDDDFNRLMGGESNSKHFGIVLLICIVVACLLAWSVATADEVKPHVDEQCATSFSCQSITVWDLMYYGKPVDMGKTDMTMEECLAAKDELEEQTKIFTDEELKALNMAPFSNLSCRPRLVERQDS